MESPQTAADALDRIREGGAYVVTLAHERIDDAKRALSEGDFPTAAVRLQEAVGRVQVLCHATAAMGEFGADQRIIRGMDVDEGMALYGWGTVASVEERVTHPGDSDEIITIVLESGDRKRFYGEQELVLVQDAE